MNLNQILHYKISLFTTTGIFILVFVITNTIQQIVLGDNPQIDFRCYTIDQTFWENGTQYIGGNIECP